jgi:hypothetical protein
MLKHKCLLSITKILLLIALVGACLSASNSSSTTNAFMNSGVKANNISVNSSIWQSPAAPDFIGWTTTAPLFGAANVKQDVGVMVTCGGIWSADSLPVNVWAVPKSSASGVNHYLRRVYKTVNLTQPFSLISTSLFTNNYVPQINEVIQTDGIYEVEVASVDNVGHVGDFSPRCRLTVDHSPLLTPIVADVSGSNSPTESTLSAELALPSSSPSIDSVSPSASVVPSPSPSDSPLSSPILEPSPSPIDASPSAALSVIDDQHVGFELNNVKLFDHLDYTLLYSHPVSTEEATLVQEGLAGSLVFATGSAQVSSDPLYLGTCSSGGTCTAHLSPTDFHLHVDLKGSGIPNQAVETVLP